MPGCHDGSLSFLFHAHTSQDQQTLHKRLQQDRDLRTCYVTSPSWVLGISGAPPSRSNSGTTGKGGHPTQGRTHANKSPRHKKMLLTNKKEIQKERTGRKLFRREGIPTRVTAHAALHLEAWNISADRTSHMDPSWQRRAQEASLHGASFLARPGWTPGVSGSRAGRQELATHGPPGVTGDCSGRHQHQGHKLGQAPWALRAAPQVPQAMLPNKPLTGLRGLHYPSVRPSVRPC